MDRPAILFAQYLPTAAAVATDSYAGTEPAEVLTATEDTYWRPADQSGAKAVTLDFGENKLLNRLALLGANLDGIRVELRGSSDNFSSSNELLVAEETLAAPAGAGTLALAEVVTFRYLRLTLAAGYFPSNLRLAHLAAGLELVLPYLAEDFDPDQLTATGEHLVSREGFYLGSERERTMRRLALQLGQVTEAEFQSVNQWAAACLGGLAPFFFIPDRAAALCYFAWSTADFSAPRRGGLRDIKAITIETRAV